MRNIGGRITAATLRSWALLGRLGKELDSKAVADPYAAVRVDTAIARHALAPGRLVSGLVYDVNTGLIEIVDPAPQE